MSRKTRAFVPSALGRLEDRVVLSPGAHFTLSGAAILTTRAYSRAAGNIYNAYVRFATRGQNLVRLNADLARAVGVIPYNRMDGLVDTLQSEATTLVGNISAGVPGSVIAAYQASTADLKQFVQSEVASGRIVVR
jgi:hypothetical protein